MVRVPPLDGLPAAGPKRWVARRKAAVLAAVRRGLITREEACRRYELSEEEFSSWQSSYETHGIDGLRVTPFSDTAAIVLVNWPELHRRLRPPGKRLARRWMRVSGDRSSRGSPYRNRSEPSALPVFRLIAEFHADQMGKRCPVG